MNILIIAVMPFVFAGIINKVKAFWAGRKGPSVFKPFFDFVKLVKKRNEEYKESILAMPDCTLSESLMHISSTMPVRNLRVEPKVLRRNQNKANYPPPKADSRYSDNQNCKCLLF